MMFKEWARLPAAALALACAAASWPGAAAAQPSSVSAGAWPASKRIGPIAEWVAANGDNEGLPFAVIDKETAQLAVYDARGGLRGMAPVLVGSAVGDGSAPGVGERPLSAIAPEERTTPAGRFLGRYGPTPEGGDTLWVDYAAAISLHPVVDTNPAERRPDRLLSPTPKDNRITFGCINVANGFYEDVVRPAFLQGGVFYVLPESGPVESILPGLGDLPEVAANAAAGPGF